MATRAGAADQRLAGIDPVPDLLGVGELAGAFAGLELPQRDVEERHVESSRVSSARSLAGGAPVVGRVRGDHHVHLTK